MLRSENFSSLTLTHRPDTGELLEVKNILPPPFAGLTSIRMTWVIWYWVALGYEEGSKLIYCFDKFGDADEIIMRLQASKEGREFYNLRIAIDYFDNKYAVIFTKKQIDICWGKGTFDKLLDFEKANSK